MADILIAEDDADVRKWLSVALETEGYAVDTAENGVSALEAVRRKRPDLLILDVMMPACDGFTVCSEIRKADASLPILMLTARDSEQDEVKGLGLGADDYVTKPFSMMELFARIGARLRRSALMCASKASFMIGTARIDESRMSVVDVEGRETPLAAREYELLKLLASH